MAGSTSPQKQQPSAGTSRGLNVAVLSARGLKKAGRARGGLLAGSCDPFCVCEITGRSDARFETPMVFNSTEPVWNHEHNLADYVAGDDLSFTVWNKDVGRSEDCLGQATLEAHRFLGGFDGEVALAGGEKGKGEESALRVRVAPAKAPRSRNKFTVLPYWWSSGSQGDAISAPSGVSATADLPLKVTIHKATGLRCADWLPGEGANQGLSDPYCTCEVVGKGATRIKTHIVQDNNDPEWDFSGELHGYSPGDSLLFAVWDQDWGKADDFLGATELAAFHFDPVAFDGEITLSDAGPGMRPKLHVRVELADFEKTLGVSSVTGLGIRRKLWSTWSKYAPVKVTQDMDGEQTVTGLHLRKRMRSAPERVNNAVAQKKREAKLAFIDMVWSRRQLVLLATRDTLREAMIADPDMCYCLRRRISDLLEHLWCDIMTEVEIMVEAARVGVAGQSMHDVESLALIGREPPHILHPLAIRGFLLYHWLPYDKSFFGQLKDPFYIPFLVVSFVPVLRNFLYGLVLLLLLIPGPPDEYQLVQFIMAFKATQFLSGGVYLATAGTWKYYWCVGLARLHNCEEYGPGESKTFGEYYGDLGVLDILGSCALVWSAFLLLPYSEQNAGLRKTEAEEAHEQPATSERGGCLGIFRRRPFQYEGRGGRLGGLLRYDFYCFVFTVFALVALELTRYKEDPKFLLDYKAGGLLHTWKFRETLYVVRVLYGWTSLPFAVFNLPVLSRILTHTVSTGFNRRGACVAYLLPPVEPLDEHVQGADNEEAHELMGAFASV